MEGWLVGLFTLLGVLVGGLFTYLGLREQLKQQKEISRIEWKRKIRSEPLLKLRAELVVMADKLDRLATTAHKLHTRFGQTEEEVKKELQQNVEDVNNYITIGNFNQTLFMQYDKELRDAAENIIKEYRGSYFQAVNYKDYKARELGEAMEVLKKNADKIVGVQEIINKKLEEL